VKRPFNRLVAAFSNSYQSSSRKSKSKNGASRFPAEQAKKIRNILTLFHGAEKVEYLKYPGAGLHPLKGDLRDIVGKLSRTPSIFV
jgi:hypothetical protein